MSLTWRKLTSPTEEDVTAAIVYNSAAWLFAGGSGWKTGDPDAFSEVALVGAASVICAFDNYAAGSKHLLASDGSGGFISYEAGSGIWGVVVGAPIWHPVNYNSITLAPWAGADAVAVGPGGDIWHIETDGATYHLVVPALTTNDLNGIAGYDASNIWAVGDGGTFLNLSTVAGGVGTSVNINGIYVDYTAGRLRIIVACNGGEIWRYDSGDGATWAVETSGVTDNLLTCVYYNDMYWAGGEGGVILLGFEAYAMTASVAGGHGTITPATYAAYAGEDVTFTITPADGYEVAHIYDNGVSKTPANSYTVSGVAADHNILVDFSLIPDPTVWVWTVYTVTGEL